MNVSRDDATEWASWFRSLGDPTRVLILNLLASEARPMSVGEIVERLDVGQSTISHHLKILGDVRFILVDRVGTTSWWRINEACLDCFPTAADLVRGRLPADTPWNEPQLTSRRARCPPKPTRCAKRSAAATPTPPPSPPAADKPWTD